MSEAWREVGDLRRENDALRAERAKLEAALLEARKFLHAGNCELAVMVQIDAALPCAATPTHSKTEYVEQLAQPAESGAPGLMHDKTDAWDFEHAKRRVIEQTEHGFVARDIGAKP